MARVQRWRDTNHRAILSAKHPPRGQISRPRDDKRQEDRPDQTIGRNIKLSSEDIAFFLNKIRADRRIAKIKRGGYEATEPPIEILPHQVEAEYAKRALPILIQARNIHDLAWTLRGVGLRTWQELVLKSVRKDGEKTENIRKVFRQLAQCLQTQTTDVSERGEDSAMTG